MSLNIQTSNGLLEIGGKVTKEKVIEALGYSPADEAHVEDGIAHITSEERETWNNKSDVVAYSDLLEAPNIRDDESGNLTIADNNENVIMKVDANGITTTSVNTRTINLNGEDLGVRLDEIESASLPNIVDDESGELSISDEAGNKIVKIDADGLTTTTVTAQNVVVGGKDVGIKFDEQQEDINGVSSNLTAHTSNSNIHISADERTLWNNKSDIHTYADLPDAPSIEEDDSGEVIYADESGNVIAKINEDGFKTTQVIANKVVAGGVNVGEIVSSHVGNDDIHITAAERQSWNEKADAIYVDQAVANLVNSAPEKLNTLDELAAALGDDENFATTVTNQIALKVDQTEFDAHTHIKADVGLGNVDNTSDANKPVSTAQREALDSLKSELSESIVSKSKEWTIADNSGNIIAKVDSNGLETTTVTAQSIVANGIDVETALDNKANKATTLSGYGIVDAASKTHSHFISDVADLQTALDGKSDDNHSHDEYLVESDISGLVTTSYVDEQLALKANVSHTHNQYLEASDIADKADKSYVDEQLVTKANTITGGASTIASSNLTASRALVSDSSGKVAVSAVTSTELGYLDGVTSNVQTQLDSKASLTHIHPYGVCSSSATYTTKTVTVENFSLVEGARVIVKFTNANSASSPKLNVNSTGAIPIIRYGTTAAGSNTATNGWEAGAILAFTYDGTNWVQDYWYNTTYTNASLGQGYGTCYTSTSTAEKEVSMSNYEDKTGGVVSIKFTYSVDADATLNINGQGAMPIYYKASTIVDNVIKGGDIATFICSGSSYRLISVDRWHEDITELQVNDSRVRQMPTSTNGNFRLLLTPSFQSEDTTAYTYFDNDVYLNPYYNKLYGVDINGNAGSADKLNANTVTITLSASSWSSSSQIVSVEDVTDSNNIIITPVPSSHTAYCEAGVYCSAQADKELTFTCSETPAVDLMVNVLILN